MKMKIEHTQTLAHALQIQAAMAQPFKLLTYLFAAVTDLVLNLPVMNTVWRERRELEQMKDIHIKDIGLTTECISQESNRSYFDIPNDRKRSLRSISKATCGNPL